MIWRGPGVPNTLWQQQVCARTTAHFRLQHTVACAARRNNRNHSQAERFQQHFTSIYGDQRWPTLWQALQQPVPHAAYANPFTSPAAAGHHQPTLDGHFYTAADALCHQQGWLPLLSNQWPVYQSGRGSPHHQHHQHQQQQQQQQQEQQQSHAATDPTTGLRCLYFLDPASLLPALTLAPQPGERVLDMCAAPGGKALLLSGMLFGALPHPSQHHHHTQQHQQQQQQQQRRRRRQQAYGLEEAPPVLQPRQQSADLPHSPLSNSSPGASSTSTTSSSSSADLVVNDRSSARASRLAAVMREYLPPEQRARISVTSHDGTRWWQHEQAAYDALLLDAPCSSERHLALRGTPVTREDWSPSRSQRNAATQLALLLSAAQLLKPGGRLVYSTCSISPGENDGVVGKALKKSKVPLVQVPVEDWWPQLKRQCIGGGSSCDNLQAVMPGVAAGQASAATVAAGSAGDAAAAVVHAPAGAHASWLEGVEVRAHGLHALPDRTGGYGPIYWSLLQRPVE